MAKAAVYAGTFDPITNGHEDIILRAAGIFERLHIGVVEKPNKKTLFDAAERVELVQKTVAALDPTIGSRIQVASFGGLLMDYVKELGCRVVIRGLRAVTDYEYEAQMAVINRHLQADVETVFLMTSDHCSFISSSIVREIARYGGDVSGLVPQAVAEKLKAAFSERK